MRAERSYSVYTMASKLRRLYTGMTGDLHKRAFEHKQDLVPGFSSRYRMHWLVHYEKYPNVWSAIDREKEIKGWRRSKKVALIESENPTWEDLAEHWYDDVPTFFGLRKAGPSLRSG